MLYSEIADVNARRMSLSRLESGSEVDLALINGKIVTVDPKFSIHEAVAVRDGRIYALGLSADIKRTIGEKTEVVDLDGKMVLPGLIDSHLHMLSTGLTLFMINCRTPPVKSIEDIKAAVKGMAGKAKPGEWIEGRGWDQAKLAEHRNPTRWDLDEASPDNPVFLTRTCGHVVVVNSKALEIAEIDRDTLQPVGGEIVKDERGEPTGLLHEMPAFHLVKKHIRPPDLERKVEAIKLTSEAFSRVGLTSVVEAGITEDEIRAYQITMQDGGLTVRVSMMLRGIDGDEPEDSSIKRIKQFPLITGFGNDMLQFLGLKLLIDGGIGGRTALMREPYEGEADNCGILTVPEDKLQRLVDAGNMQDMNIGIHCAGGKAMDVVLNAFEKTNRKKSIKGRRFSLIHAYQPSEKNFEQCQKLGVCVASQPSFLYYLGDSYHENVGLKRAEWLKPHRAWLDHGILVASGTDSPVTPYPPFPSLWASIARKTELKGTQLGEEQKITRQEAIKMYTINGAYLTLQEETKGSIELGKFADMVIIDRNILTCAEDEIKDAKVLRTIVGGKTVYKVQ